MILIQVTKSREGETNLTLSKREKEGKTVKEKDSANLIFNTQTGTEISISRVIENTGDGRQRNAKTVQIIKQEQYQYQ